jgi:hypothetical protein
MGTVREFRRMKGTYPRPHDHMSWPPSILVESECGFEGRRRFSVFPGSLFTTLVMRQGQTTWALSYGRTDGHTLKCNSTPKPLVVNCSKLSIPISDLCDHEQFVALNHAVRVAGRIREAEGGR